MAPPVPDLNPGSNLTDEKVIAILEAERRTFTDVYVPPHATKLDLIQKCVMLTAQDRDSIKRNTPRKRAHIILNDLWTSIPEAFLLSAAAIQPTKLGSLKSTTYLGKILEWWKTVEHPKGLTQTFDRLDILKALPDRTNPGPQNALGGFIGSMGSPTSILGSSNTILPTGEKDPIPHDQLVPQAVGTTDMLWMELDGMAATTQPDLPDEMPCTLNQVFDFLGHYFEKAKVTFESNTANPHIDIKWPFGQISTRILLDWETSNEFIRYIKTGAV